MNCIHEKTKAPRSESIKPWKGSESALNAIEAPSRSRFASRCGRGKVIGKGTIGARCHIDAVAQEGLPEDIARI